MPAVRRTPYLHFIVDCSATATSHVDSVTGRIAEICAALPEVSHCQVKLANYEFLHLTSQPVVIGGEPQDRTYSEFQHEMNLINRATSQPLDDYDRRVLDYMNEQVQSISL